MDDQRDYQEEAYWRDYCAECDGKCTNENSHAEELAGVLVIDESGRWVESGENNG